MPKTRKSRVRTLATPAQVTPAQSMAVMHPEMEPEKIRTRAYALYAQRGGEHGHDMDDWLEAERQLLNGK